MTRPASQIGPQVSAYDRGARAVIAMHVVQTPCCSGGAALRACPSRPETHLEAKRPGFERVACRKAQSVAALARSESRKGMLIHDQTETHQWQ